MAQSPIQLKKQEASQQKEQLEWWLEAGGVGLNISLSKAFNYARNYFS